MRTTPRHGRGRPSRGRGRENGQVGGFVAEFIAMKLVVNGEKHEYDDGVALVSVLSEMGAESNKVAVMVNEEVINFGDRDSVKLKDGDVVEVLTFAAGG